MGDNMLKVTKQLFCDRCKQEIPKVLYYDNIFDEKQLRIKFYKLKFTAIPHRWSRDGNISEKYCIEKEKYLSLCPQCAKSFCEWWEATQ